MEMGMATPTALATASAAVPTVVVVVVATEVALLAVVGLEEATECPTSVPT